MKSSGFGDIFVLIITKGHQSTNWKSLLWKTEERESNRELVIMSLQWLLLSSTQAQKTAISGQPKYGQAAVRFAADESSDSHTHQPCMCARQRRRESRRRERKALQSWCTPADQVIFCFTRFPLKWAFWLLWRVLNNSQCTQQHSARAEMTDSVHCASIQAKPAH